MPDLIKVGITDDLERRMKELDKTGTPLPFECFYAVEIDENIAPKIEKKIHEGFDDKRIRHNREFFSATPEQAKSILEIAEIMGGKDVTPKEDIVELHVPVVIPVYVSVAVLPVSAGSGIATPKGSTAPAGGCIL